MSKPAAPPPPFDSPYRHGFVRLAACVPRITLADPRANADETLALLRRGHDQSIALMVFPELGLSAYSIDDLLQQDVLLDAVEAGIGRLVEASRDLYPAFAVGAPLRFEGRLFNTAVIIHGGRILGVTPKSFLPNYREYYERRWFASGLGVTGRTIRVAGLEVPFGTDLLFRSEPGAQGGEGGREMGRAELPGPSAPISTTDSASSCSAALTARSIRSPRSPFPCSRISQDLPSHSRAAEGSGAPMTTRRTPRPHGRTARRSRGFG